MRNAVTNISALELKIAKIQAKLSEIHKL